MIDPGASEFPPIADSARLYSGAVMHARLDRIAHRFSYRVFCLLIDLDRIDEADRLSRFFSVNRANLVSFRESDHGDGPERSLRERIDALLAGAGIDRPARIQLLCYPRILGYAFNPLSVYYCHGARGGLSAIVYEVRNTFGGRHTYVCPVRAEHLSEAGIRQEHAKAFYVSPFIGPSAFYRFRVLPPGDAVRLRILETEQGKPLLAATFTGEAVPLTSARLLGLVARMPLMTFKVVAAIHWEALKLWLKGATFHKKEKPAADRGHAKGAI